ncbi:enoyl-CoA hydratase/isomerase family protein [Natrialbaceae archaeon AArc-T1-2]|uniref:enoyl-CoA hydratase/isomerase family protein n=1 Tax=Natrialbaceae archaeon AArc-T1-2 TaxID=3053904 RepID=UPI00255A9951|nr:enoyl-CoA hydratase/isomerase family protein [Natrialbaceae archaeon AArc-T1-2]WIV68192.1 enoyl-CoA hydratase/isomerase family protein [Natrialbaceae archaeon AArc-T1-2]
MTEHVIYECDGDVSTVRLNRPDKLNSLSLSMWDAIPDAIQQARQDGARAIVLTGTGRAFCAGDDIGTLEAIDSEWDVRELTETAFECFRAIERAPIPVIGMANGSAYGGGFELLLSCDMTVVPEDATFALPEVQIGAYPFYATKRLAVLIGKQRAMELSIAGREISGQTAADWGVFARAVPEDEVSETVEEIIDGIREGSPGSIDVTKSWLNASLRFPGEDDAMRSGFGYLYAGPDAHEGAAAFGEDRDPEYTGSE